MHLYIPRPEASQGADTTETSCDTAINTFWCSSRDCIRDCVRDCDRDCSLGDAPGAGDVRSRCAQKPKAGAVEGRRARQRASNPRWLSVMKHAACGHGSAGRWRTGSKNGRAMRGRCGSEGCGSALSRWVWHSRPPISAQDRVGVRSAPCSTGWPPWLGTAWMECSVCDEWGDTPCKSTGAPDE